MGFLRDISPKRAASDFATVWKGENPHRWRILAISLALTAGFMILLIPKSERAAPQPPKISHWISTFAPDRTDEEIIASNIENQKRKEERAAELARIEERRKELYRQLGQATGIDTDEMERRIAEEEAADEATEGAAEGATNGATQESTAAGN